MTELKIYQSSATKTRCPTCGWETTKGCGVTFTLEGEATDFCFNCYFAWFRQNIPKMETVDES
jgi:hypothetical protein